MSATILIIDDSEDDQRLYLRAFKDFDCFFSLVAAASAEAGLARVADAKPDLILLDYGLPDADGLSFMKRLAEHTDTPVPIVMLTGEGNTEVAVEAMKHGAADYLIKDTGGRYLRLLPSVAGRVMAAQAQREQNKRLQQETGALLRRNQALMQNAMDGIHVMNMQGDIVEANDAFCRMLGYTQEEMARLNVADWDAQWSAEELRERFKWLIGKSAGFETVHRRKDGSLIDVEISTSGMEIEGQYFLFAASRDITERKRAEEELKLSAQLLNSTSDSVFLFDLDGNFVYLNEAAWKSRGYTRDEMMAMKLPELNTPEFRKLVAPRIKEILENGQGCFESAHYCKDGSVMPVEISSRVIESGGRKLLLATIRDITERKRVEGTLKLNKSIIENAYDGFWMFDIDGFLLDANQAYADMVGYTREELAGMHISRLSVQSNTPELVRARIEMAITHGASHFETQHRHKDGRVMDFDASIAYIPEAKCLFSFIRDITERKKAEAILSQHKLVIDTSIDGFWITDMQGHLLEANEAYAKISGYPVEELVNMHISQLEAIELSPEDVQAHIAKVVAQGYDRFETRHRHKDGHEIDIEISVTYMAESQWLAVFCHDITGRKQAEAALLNSEANLRAMLDNSPYLTWLKDAHGRYITVNKVFADYLRLENVHQATGKTDLDLQPQELAEKYRADDAEVMAARQRKHVEESAFDGNDIHWVETFKTPIIDAHGHVLGTVGFAKDITERKRMQLKTETLLRRNQALMQNSMDGIHVLDVRGNIVEANDAFCRMLGYSREEVAGFNVDDWAAEFSGGESRVRFEDHTGNSAMIETLHRRKDGALINVEISVTREEIDGQVLLFCSSRDITERKQAEKKMLLESAAERKRAEVLAQQFGSLLQSSVNEIYLFDADSLRFLETSEGAEKNLGYSAEELEQLTPLDLKPAYTRESFESLIAPLRRGEQQVLLFETSHRRKDGTTYPVEIRLQFMEADFPVFLAIVQDITERRRAGELLRKSSAEIEDLYNHAPCGYHSLDRAGIIRRINDTELAWLGYTRDEVVGKMKLTDLLTPAGRQTFHETFPQLMQQGFIHDIELEMIRRDGTVLVGLISATAIYESGGGFMMTRSAVVDITGRKRAELQTRELSAHLQVVREEEKASFAREIHDDLGGTLAALKMDAHWLARKLAAEKEMTPLLERAEAMFGLLDTAVKAMRRIVTDLRPTILDDLGLLEAIKWQADQFHKRTGIECRIICSGDEGCEEKLDKMLSINLFRIFQEALTNIARHSGASRVEIELHKGDEEVILSVSDNGRGLPQGHTIATTSFGIRSMRERVGQLGGKIMFDKPPGGGLGVTVILPRPASPMQERA